MYQTLINCITMITFSIRNDDKSFTDLILTEESTGDDIIDAVKQATGVSAFADTQMEQQVLQVAFTELKELINSNDELESWKGTVRLYASNSQGNWLVTMGKALVNGVKGSAIVNALSGSMSS